MSDDFSYESRVLMCNGCGTPFDAPSEGGTFTCSHCDLANELAPRRQRLPRPRRSKISEQVRLGRLREQDGKERIPPRSVLLPPNGSIAAWKIDDTLALWQSAREEVTKSSRTEAAERLHFLTAALSDHYSDQKDHRRQRACFESAMEALRFRTQKQVMMGCLSRQAAIIGDVVAAQDWLALMDTDSSYLDADSAYRLSKAVIDTARGDWHAVLTTLGASQTDVPIIRAMDTLAAMLRANALEENGDVGAASAVLRQHMAEGGAAGRRQISAVTKTYDRLGLCQESLAGAETEYTQQAGRMTGLYAGGGIGRALLGGAALWIVIGGVVALLAGNIEILEAGAILGLIFVLVSWPLRRAGQRAAYLRIHGLEATATVIAAEGTGTRTNKVVEYEVTVTIELEGQELYEASFRTGWTFNLIPQLQAGNRVAVRVHPKKPQVVLLEDD